jgi:carboxyl-terminal processing protease
MIVPRFLFSRPLRPMLALALATACGGRATPTMSPASAALPAACGGGAGGGSALAASPAADALVTFDTAWAIIARTHWDTTYNGVNWRAARDELRPRAEAARTRGELRQVLSEMVARLGQSHFSIIPQEVSDATSGATDAQPNERRGGNGTAGFDVRLADPLMLVSSVDTGGPAWRAGVRPGWVLESVRGCPVDARVSRIPSSLEPRRRALMAWQATSGSLGGLEGDTLPVVFRDGSDAPRAVSIVLGQVRGTITKFGNLPPVAADLSWHRVRRAGRTVGVIHFNIWMPVLAAQFDAAIDSLRDADAIVLDLRGNLGGVGGMSMGIAGHFLDSAVALGEMQQRSGTMRFRANPRRVDTRLAPVQPFSGPLALVVDPLSASTTEIFAGGLQALGRATVFGTQSAGQALPSVPERLPNGDILYHAVANFIGATGQPLEGAGVNPDQVIVLDRRALLDGRDPALEAAIEWAVQRAPRRPLP